MIAFTGPLHSPAHHNAKPESRRNLLIGMYLPWPMYIEALDMIQVQRLMRSPFELDGPLGEQSPVHMLFRGIYGAGGGVDFPRLI